MTEQQGQGWFDDPTQRHRTRWYDGTRWTEHVVGPDGAVARDDLRAEDRALPAPGQAAAPAQTDVSSSSDATADSDADSATTVVGLDSLSTPASGSHATPEPQPAAPSFAAQGPAQPAQQYPAQQTGQPDQGGQQWGAPPPQAWNQAPQQAPQQWPPQQPAQQWGAPPQQAPAQQGWQQPEGQQGWQQPEGQQGWQQPEGQQPWQQQPQGGAWGYPATGAPGTGRVRYAPGPGIGVGAVGVVLLVLSLFALKWGDGDKSKFLDIRKVFSRIPDSADLTFVQTVYTTYLSWAAFVLLGVAVVLVVLAGIPIPQNAAGNTYARVIGALFAGLGAVIQTVTITQISKGPATPQFGAWLGVAGWIIVAAGFVLGARRVPA